MYVRINRLLITFIYIYIIIPKNGKMFSTQTYPLATTTSPKITQFPLSRYERGLEDYEEEQISLSEGRGMMAMEDVDHMQSEKAIKNDPWQGYYDFLINEGSFKFWAVFQVVTAAVLIYSAFAAVYYAKYNYIQTDYDYADYFLRRSYSRNARSTNEWYKLSSQTIQRILDAISSEKYS